MKRLYIFIIALVVLLGAGGLLFFKFWYTDDLQEVWELVPDSAILIYESTKTVQNWNEIQSKSIWSSLEQIPFYASIGKGIDNLDSLSGRQGRLDKLVQGKPFVFSLHRVSNEDLDALFFVKLESVGDYDVLNKLVAQFKQRDDFRFQTRSYQGFTINEAVNKDYEEIFSYIVHKNYFVGSFTPILVEDVIRKLSGQLNSSFSQSNPQLSQVAKLENDQGNLYINNRKLPQLFSVFVQERDSEGLSLLRHLAQSTFLDFKMTDDQILLNGFTVLDPESHQYLRSVQGSQGAALGFKHLLSNDVAILYHLTFQDANTWQKRLETYWEAYTPQQINKRSSLRDAFAWDPQGLTSVLDTEIGLAVMETLDEEEPDRLIYLRFSDFNEGLAQLNRIAEKTAAAGNDSLYVETFAGKEIRQINTPEFPAHLWGDLFSGFEQTFFIPFDEYLVLSNSIQSLKDLVQSIEAEETWGKSIRMGQFLEQTLQEANLSIYMDLGKTWNILERQLAPRWLGFVNQNSKVIKGFELLAFQFSDIGDKFYSSGVIAYRTSQVQPQTAQRFLTVQQAFTAAPIISRPFVVKNHNNGTREVLVQDSLNILYQISSQGRVLWRDSLPAPVRGEISQIDYFKNAKLQYLLATDHEIHIIDRNGAYLEGFPVTVPTETVLRNVRAIDYDNSKRYRLIASDDNGQIFMFDKEGKALDGWRPKVMKDQLIFAPQHIRVRGKDCIIAIQKDGMVHIMNRRGESYPGFPLDLKGPTQSPLFMEIGTDFKKTNFTTINTSGQIVKFNLEGSVLDRRQLVKPSRDTRYQLCIDPLLKNYVIIRQNANRLGILNRRGEILLEKDYLTSGQLQVQYYLFNNDRSIFAVTDPVQQFTYFYNQEGVLINSTPIENSKDVGLLYFEGQRKYHVYSVYDGRFSILSF